MSVYKCVRYVKRWDRPCFQLDNNDDVMVRCLVCQTDNGLNASVRLGEPCIECGAKVPFPAYIAMQTQKKVQVCYECLRAGRAAITKDTVLGLIAWENAAKGQTQGVPGLSRTDIELVTVEDDWTAARLAPPLMWELLRTPGYANWQGELWHFDEGQPMIYVGEWNQADFNRHAPNGDGKKLFDEIISDGLDDHWEYIKGEMSSVYVFRSATREKWAAHWDAD